MDKSSNYKIASYPFLASPVTDPTGNLSLSHGFSLHLRDKPIFIHKLFVDFFYSLPNPTELGTNPDAVAFRHNATNWAFTAMYNTFNLEHAPKPLAAQNLSEGTFGIRVIPLEGRIIDAWLNTGGISLEYFVHLRNLLSDTSYNITIVLEMFFVFLPCILI